MESVLSLPVELQIVLLSGYLAYRVTVAGRAVTHRTEDFLLQVLVFGAIGRMLGGLIMALPWFAQADNELEVFLTGMSAVVTAVGIASCWRRFGKRWWVAIMGKTGVFRDDLEPTAWSSLMNANAKWRFIQLYCNDGNIYESIFGDVPAQVPCDKITINEDGVLIYITRVIRPDGSELETPIEDTGNGYEVAYFPRSEINRLAVGWIT